jgi:predicted nucleic-acid-binding protein
MPVLDASVLMRCVVEDDAAQFGAANQIVSRCVGEGATLFVPVTVVPELEWVLRSSYGFEKDDVLLTLSSLFAAAELSFELECALQVALPLFREDSPDFADCLHVALTTQAREQLPWTFDKGAAKVSDAQFLPWR